jgi:hypothetical protein
MGQKGVVHRLKKKLKKKIRARMRTGIGSRTWQDERKGDDGNGEELSNSASAPIPPLLAENPHKEHDGR